MVDTVNGGNFMPLPADLTTGGGLNNPTYTSFPNQMTQPLITPAGSVGSSIGSIIDLIRGVNGTSVDQAQGIADVADPFRQQRPQYQTELHDLLTDPNSFKMDAGTQFAVDQGTAAIQRAANAQGVSRGGSVVADIGDFVTGTANQAYNTRIQQLLTLSGATTGSPAAAAGAIAAGNANRNQDIAGGLNGINGLLQTLFGTSSTSGIAGPAISAITRWLGGGSGVGGNDGSGGFQIPGGISGLFAPGAANGGENPLDIYGNNSPLQPGSTNPDTPFFTNPDTGTYDPGGSVGFGNGNDTGGSIDLGNDTGGIDWGNIFGG